MLSPGEVEIDIQLLHEQGIRETRQRSQGLGKSLVLEKRLLRRLVYSRHYRERCLKLTSI
jgi:hypothetical protein